MSGPERGEPGLFGPDVGRREPGSGAGAGERGQASGGRGGGAAPGGPLEPADPEAPLAARMRPRTLEEFVGQRQAVGPGAAIRELIERDRLPSLIFWGPPGCGKTTLAAVIARATDSAFVPFSAVTEGIARVRELIAQARDRKRATGRDTILFVDEIHRFNKAQQDAFLPHVEAGTVTLIGATTENPSFEVVGPLLSRTRVVVLEALEPEQVAEICRRALEDPERGLGGRGLEISDDALRRLAEGADGDARRALNALETAADLASPAPAGRPGEGRAAVEARPADAPDGPGPEGGAGRIGVREVEEALQRRFPRYDKGGEEHYNLISALHKAVRGSDPDGALYWLARMLEAGEDPLYIARRLVRMASEDVGLADPSALAVSMAARDAFHFLGSPEGDLALAEATVYLAAAPKSNRVYTAFGEARAAARRTPAEPVPLHIRNAPTRLMKEVGYGRDYRYDPDEEGGVAPQTYLPEALEGRRFYEPGERGREEAIGRRLARVRRLRRREAGGEEGDAGD